MDEISKLKDKLSKMRETQMYFHTLIVELDCFVETASTFDAIQNAKSRFKTINSNYRASVKESGYYIAKDSIDIDIELLKSAVKIEEKENAVCQLNNRVAYNEYKRILELRNLACTETMKVLKSFNF